MLRTFAILAGVSSAALLPRPTAAEALERPVVGLSTEWYPLQESCVAPSERVDPAARKLGWLRQNRLLREIARQGVLIVAREDLGLTTRDETLDEPMPPKATTLSLRFRCWQNDPGSIELLAASKDTPTAGPAAAPTTVLWRQAFEHNKRWNKAPAKLAAEMNRSAADIAAALEDGGFSPIGSSKRRPGKLSKEPVPESVERLLRRMDFVSQFAAIRKAHQERRDGPLSAQWLTVLARGYANLALMTQHYWSSHTEAFAARALLYAERLVEQQSRSPDSLATRAYVQAVIGMHSVALDLSDKLATPTNAPAWQQVVRPYCEFDTESLNAIAQDRPAAKPLVAMLVWEHARGTGDARRIYDVGRATLESCPQAYGVGNTLASQQPLAVKRFGSQAGADALAKRLPIRLAALQDLPAQVTNLLREPQQDAHQKVVFTPLASRIAQSMRRATRTAAGPEEPSLAILGGLIAEEQFVQLERFLNVIQDGTAVPFNAAVAQLAPLAAGHRYEPYLRSLAFPRNAPAHTQILRGVEPIDPRGNMLYLLGAMGKLSCRNDWEITGSQMVRSARYDHNHTYPGLLEAYQVLQPRLKPVSATNRRQFGTSMRYASKDSPFVLRMKIPALKSPTREELARCEGLAKSDPQAWRLLGDAYLARNDLPATARCYQRSNDLSPSYEVVVKLAETYVRLGKDDLGSQRSVAIWSTKTLGWSTPAFIRSWVSGS